MITKQMVIGDIVVKYPEAASRLTEYGIHCVGCGVAGMETLEQGLGAHGMTEEKIDKIVVDLNSMVKDTPKKETSEEKHDLNLTESAVSKLKEIMTAEKKEGLRLSVMAGGCSGFRYGMEMVDKANDSDITIEKHGIKIFVDKEGMQHLNGITVDYVDSLQGAGFKIENPNSKESCGCGESFS